MTPSIDSDFDETSARDEYVPSLLMDQSINRHNSLTLGGNRHVADTDVVGGLSGGEFSLFAMNRGRERFIEILTTWQKAKDKKEERALKDKEKEALVSS